MTRLLLPAALLAVSCAGDDDDTGIVDTAPPPECTEDDNCDANEICEEQTCVLGDRDDTFDGARALYIVPDLDDPGVRQGLIQTPGDVDHYVFEAAEAGWYRISTLTDDGDDALDTVVSVFRADGALHHVMDDYPTGSLRSYDSRMQVYLPTAGTWYIRVEDRSTFYDEEPLRGSPAFSYRIGLETWGVVTVEPDSAGDPSVRFPMESGSVVYAWGVRAEEPGDVDHTVAVMPWGDAPFEVWAPAAIPGSAMTPVVEVRDSEGTLHLRKEAVGSTGFASTFSTPDETFSVSVTDLDSGGSDDHWTVLYLRTRDPGYGNPREVEPNDTVDEATPLDAETRSDGGVTSDVSFLQGKLDVEGDTDHFRFAAVAGGRLRLVCSSDSYGATGNVDVDVLDPAGERVVTLTDGDDSAPDGEVEDLEEGAYTLRFKLAVGSFGPSAYYRCGVYADRP